MKENKGMYVGEVKETEELDHIQNWKEGKYEKDGMVKKRRMEL